MAHYLRLKKAFYDLENYRKIYLKKDTQILKEMEQKSNQQRFYKFAPWNKKGTLPIWFAHPKEKDPFNKERGIASYFKHPMRKLYRRANKALTWLFRQLPKNYPHFTLHKLHNLKNRVMEAPENTNKRL